jgi:hypothetical protein
MLKIFLHGSIILKWTFKKWDGEACNGFIWLRIGRSYCDCGNELSGSIKCGEFLDWLRNYQLLR